MGKFLAAIVAGVIATVIGGLILNQLQGKGRRRGEMPGAMHLVASLTLEHAAPVRLRPTRGGHAAVPLAASHVTPS
jgi:hypothetical protein